MRFSASLAVAAGLLFTAPAYANGCRPEFVDSSATINVSNLEIGSGQFSRQSFSIPVRNADEGDCSATMQLVRLDGISMVDMPRYSLQSGPTTLNIAPQDATLSPDNQLIVPFAPNTPQGYAVPFEIFVPSEWGLKVGNYSEQLELTLFDSNGTKADSLLLTVNIDVPQAVALRLVGATGNDEIARIHIGTISASNGARSDPFGVRVWSTSGYRIRVSSDNRGELVHVQNLDRLPYQLFFDNQQVNLAGGDEFLFPNATPSEGTVHMMRAEAAPATVHAGDYADRIIVSVTAV